MSICQICKRADREWTMQPFGPDERVIFTAPGSHYRGFAAIAVCDECKQRVESGETVTFTWGQEVCMLNVREGPVAAAVTCHRCGAVVDGDALAVQTAADGTPRLTQWYCRKHLIAGTRRLLAAIRAQREGQQEGCAE